MPEPTVPDLRTAAQALLDALTTSDPAIGEQLDARVDRLHAALAAKATEPTPDDEVHAFCVPATLWEETLSAARRYREGWTADLDAMKWWAPEHMHRDTPAAMSLGERSAIGAIDAGRGPAPDPQGADERQSIYDDVHTELGIALGWGSTDDDEARDWRHDLVERVLFLCLDNGRAPVVGAPDEPTDDDLAELRRFHELARTEPVPWKADNALQALNARLWRDLPGLLAEVERLRAAEAEMRASSEEAWSRLEAAERDLRAATGTASEDDGWEHVADWDPDRDVYFGVEEDLSPAGRVGMVPVYRRPAGSPPPTPVPTREQVTRAVRAALVDDAGMPGAWFPDEGGLVTKVVVDTVMALLSAEPAPPLWTGETRADGVQGPPLAPGWSVVNVIVQRPPGTAVEVRALQHPDQHDDQDDDDE